MIHMMIHLWGTPPVMIIKLCVMFWKLFLSLVSLLFIIACALGFPLFVYVPPLVLLSPHKLSLYFTLGWPLHSILCVSMSSLKPLHAAHIFTFHTHTHPLTHPLSNSLSHTRLGGSLTGGRCVCVCVCGWGGSSGPFTSRTGLMKMLP